MKSFLILFFGLFLPWSALAAPPETSLFPESKNIVSRWYLDEVSGVRYDSVGSNDLTDNNTVSSTTGWTGTGGGFDYSADFTSTNSEFLSISDGTQTGLDFDGDFTFSAWVNIKTAPSSVYTLVGKSPDDQYRFFYRNPTLLQSDIWNNASESQVEETQDLGTDSWNLVTLVWDVSIPQGYLYLNGSLIGSTMTNTAATSISNENGNFQLGATANSLFLNGRMQDAKVWGLALTSTGVLEEYEVYTTVPAGEEEEEETGTGALMGSGSLIILHGACNQFTGTGEDATCSQWDTSIEIPAIEFFVRMIGKILLSVLVIIIIIIIPFKILFSVCKFFFNIFAQRFR